MATATKEAPTAPAAAEPTPAAEAAPAAADGAKRGAKPSNYHKPYKMTVRLHKSLVGNEWNDDLVKSIGELIDSAFTGAYVEGHDDRAIRSVVTEQGNLQVTVGPKASLERAVSSGHRSATSIPKELREKLAAAAAAQSMTVEEFLTATLPNN